MVPNIVAEASRHLAALDPDWPGNEWWHWVVFSIIIIAFILIMIICVIYIERRAIAWFAARVGPNRTGPYGVLQAIADAIKILLKEFIERGGTG
jgi:NADH-quinone oxidoreductase subunit H